MVGQIIGNYEVLRELGHGGMGVVYKAHDRVLDRTVALKLLRGHVSDDANYLRRFMREARAIGRLTHPNIVTVYAAGDQDGVPYIAMEYVKGKTLDTLVKEKGRLDVRQAVKLTSQIADALAAAHHNDIIHRDIKPQNIMIDEAGRVRVMDFGLAKFLMPSVTNVTVEGQILGTPLYMSPEQCSGSVVDPRTDIYSLGAVLYVMLAGRPPFMAESALAVMRCIVDEPLPDVVGENPDVPEEVVAILNKMMAKRASDRFDSAQSLHAELKSFLRRDDTQGPPRDSAEALTVILGETTVLSDTSWEKKRRWTGIAKAIAGIAVAAGLVLSGVTLNNLMQANEPAATLESSGVVQEPPPIERVAVADNEVDSLLLDGDVARTTGPQSEAPEIESDASERPNASADSGGQATSAISPIQVEENAPDPPEITDIVILSNNPLAKESQDPEDAESAAVASATESEAVAQGLIEVAQATIEETEGFEASFALLDPEKRIFRFGELVSFRVEASSDCEVLLFCTDSQGVTTLLFPSLYLQDSSISADGGAIIPNPELLRSSGGRGALQAAPPAGPVTFELYAFERRPDLDMSMLDTETAPYLILPANQDAAAYLTERGIEYLAVRTIEVEVSK